MCAELMPPRTCGRPRHKYAWRRRAKQESVVQCHALNCLGDTRSTARRRTKGVAFACHSVSRRSAIARQPGLGSTASPIQEGRAADFAFSRSNKLRSSLRWKRSSEALPHWHQVFSFRLFRKEASACEGIHIACTTLRRKDAGSALSISFSKARFIVCGSRASPEALEKRCRICTKDLFCKARIS